MFDNRDQLIEGAKHRGTVSFLLVFISYCPQTTLITAKLGLT